MLIAWWLGCASLLLAPTPLTHVPRPHARISSLTALEGPRDELKSRFSRGAEEETKTSFAPVAAKAAGQVEVPVATPNEQLLAEIRALRPEPTELPQRKEPTKVDLNGIKPQWLLVGAASYGAFSVLCWQFTQAAGQYFADNPMDSAFYVVQRLSGLARVVVIGMGALGSGVTFIAGLGQLALAVQVGIGIQKGELDPNKERIDPYGGRKQGELEKMLGLMMGDKNAGSK
mgnify:CR=1 FL=1